MRHLVENCKEAFWHRSTVWKLNRHFEPQILSEPKQHRPLHRESVYCKLFNSREISVQLQGSTISGSIVKGFHTR